MKRLIAGLLVSVAGLGAAEVAGKALPMDSERGDRMFASQGCIQCHKLKGVGGTLAPDLGRVLDRAMTPADLAGAIWNHAPAMWSAIAEKKIRVGMLTDQDASDLFASFSAARYFENPGDAGRGKRLFATKTCATCHGLTSSPNAAAKPVNQWKTLGDPVALVGAMWNHTSTMWAELSKKKLKWPDLSSQDLSDLLVYLRTATRNTETPATFRIQVGPEGAALFASKGCAACHESRPLGHSKSLTDVAASMWNHAPLLHLEPPRLEGEEINEVLGQRWASQFYAGTGDAAKGKKLFAAKRCIECHAGAGPGPDLHARAGEWSGITMVSALWRHGPDMLAQANARKIPWPVLRSGEMSDLIAYFNTRSNK
jgi:mono/diheme cytochrome c family protein